MRMSSLRLCLTALLVLGLSGIASADPISYVASTGQTATADFSFTASGQLQIHLTETTPAAASTLTGGDAILTAVGFRLPDSAVIVLSGSTVTIAPGGSSVGFSGGALGADANVSGEWGATTGGERPIGNGQSFDFVSSRDEDGVTQFAGVNRDGDTDLAGSQGGLLDDIAARGGRGVIDNSVTILLTLDAVPGGGLDALSAVQQTAFLNSLRTNSVVAWGGDDAFGTPVATPEPGTLLLLGSGMVGLGFLGRKRGTKSQQST